MKLSEHWKRKDQEVDGTYRFMGRMLITIGIQQALTHEEIMHIAMDVFRAAYLKGGLDYLQVYERSDGLKVWCIDQLNDEMKQSGEFTPDQDHWTMLLPSEY